MLTGDLGICEYEREGRVLRVVPDRLTQKHHAHYREYAQQMLAVYRGGRGTPRHVLHRQIREIFKEEPDCPPKRVRAFCKLLDDVSTFDQDRSGTSAKLRLDVFRRAAQSHPLVEEKVFLFDVPAEETRERIAEELERPWEEIEALLYRDVLSEQPLQSLGGYPSPEALLAHYNVAQLQTAFYRAEHMVIDVSTDFKRILQSCKLFRLLHEITDRGAGKYRIELTGPASLLKETRRYGAAMASLLPSILA
ncbi:MAG: DUF790 family protein, partial [Planctomycetota bacterium]